MAPEISPPTEFATPLQPPSASNGSPPCENPPISDQLSSLSPIFQLPPLTFPPGMEPPTHPIIDQAEISTHEENPFTTTTEEQTENPPDRSEIAVAEATGPVDENGQKMVEKTPAKKRRNSVKNTENQNKNTENQDGVVKKRRGRPPKIRPPPITMSEKIAELPGDRTKEMTGDNRGDGGAREEMGASVREERGQGFVNAAQRSEGHVMQPARAETERPHTDNLASLWEACQIVDSASRLAPPVSTTPTHLPPPQTAGNTYTITFSGGPQAILQLLLPSYVEDAPQNANPTGSNLNFTHQNPPSEHHFANNDPHMYVPATHYTPYAITPPTTPFKEGPLQPPYHTGGNSTYGNTDDYHYFNFLNTENEFFPSAPTHQTTHSSRNLANIPPRLDLPTCTPSFSSLAPMSPPPTAPLPNPPNFQSVHSFDLMDLAELCTRQGGAEGYVRGKYGGESHDWEVVELSHDSQSGMSSTESVMGGSYYPGDNFPEDLRELMELGTCNFPFVTVEPHPVMRPLSPPPPPVTSLTSASGEFHRPAPYTNSKSRQTPQIPQIMQHSSRPITRSMRHRMPPPTVSPLCNRRSTPSPHRLPTTTGTKTVPPTAKNGKIPLARMKRKTSQPYPVKKGSDDESGEDYYVKKQSHRDAVRRTREEIKQGLGDLKTQILMYKVPKRGLALSADRRQSNLTVVQQAIQYINALKTDLDSMEADVHKLSADNKKLESLRMRKEGAGRRLGAMREPITVQC